MDTAATPAMDSSIRVPRLVLVVVPHVPDWSPDPMSSIRNLSEYVLAI